MRNKIKNILKTARSFIIIGVIGIGALIVFIMPATWENELTLGNVINTCVAGMFIVIILIVIASIISFIGDSEQ